MHALLVALLAGATPSAETGYEDRLIAWALELHQRELEPEPVGKRVEEILIASEEIFAPSDPYPLFLNIFHKKTRESVIRREVLVQEGEAWEPSHVLETERNLRRLFILAVVKVVPVKGKDGGVALMVVTKDRWSLRLSNSFTLIGSLLQYLQLQLIETNFNGWGQQLAVNMILRLDTLTVGQSFTERRLFGSYWAFAETANLILNRQTGAPEGTSGAVSFGRPIINLDQTWGVVLNGSWNARRRRVFRGANIWQLPYPDEGGTETVPYVYDVREFAGEASYTRSWGRALKVDLTGAVGGYVHQYAPPPDSLREEQIDWLRANYLPRSENVTYLSGFFRAFPSDFKVLRNIDTYELSEDFQLGWLAQAGVRWALPLPFAPNHFIELATSVRYRFYKADDLFTVQVGAGVRLRPGQTSANQRFSAEVLNYSPRFFGGRFVQRVLVDFKFNDLDNRQLLLGGSTGLRGAFPDQVSGRHLVLGNFEYRARPFEILSNWLGIVLFYDVGSAFDARPTFVHTTGIGFRLLLPQLNREVLRIDFGFVINGPIPGPDRIVASWGQVTDLRPDTFLDQPL